MRVNSAHGNSSIANEDTARRLLILKRNTFLSGCEWWTPFDAHNPLQYARLELIIMWMAAFVWNIWKTQQCLSLKTDFHNHIQSNVFMKCKSMARNVSSSALSKAINYMCKLYHNLKIHILWVKHGTVVQWLALSPHSKKVVGFNILAGWLGNLCGESMDCSISPATDCCPAQGVPCLSPCDSWGVHHHYNLKLDEQKKIVLWRWLNKMTIIGVFLLFTPLCDHFLALILKK